MSYAEYQRTRLGNMCNPIVYSITGHILTLGLVYVEICSDLATCKFVITSVIDYWNTYFKKQES
jgi:hypothetical protein